MTTRRGATTSGGRTPAEALRARMLAGITVSSRRLDVDGVSTMVLEAGAGPPLILLHGGIETGGVYWAPVIARLAEEHRVIVPDSPGLGESDPLPRMDAESFAAWFAELIDRTCSEKPLVVGHSLNGSLAARFATSRGDQLERMVLIGVPGIGRWRPAPGFLVTAIRFSIRPTEKNNARFAAWALLDPARTRDLDREWFDAFMAYGLSRGKVREVKRTMTQLVRAGAKRIDEADLRDIPVPVALVWGRHDRMSALRIAEAAHAKLGWPLRIVEDAGHVPHIEQPEAFVDALRGAVGALGVGGV